MRKVFSLFRPAFCTEGWYRVFDPQAEGTPDVQTFARIAAKVRRFGYEGVELAPRTLADEPTKLSRTRRREYRQAAADAGVEIVGLHWLLAMTKGLHLTSPETKVQGRTAEYLARLAELTRDLGGTVMVHGSPAQRNLLADVTYEQAFWSAVNVYRNAMKVIGDMGVYVCIEQLTSNETDFLTTMAETARFVEQVGHPGCVQHLDVKALFGKCTGVAQVAALIRQYAQNAGHCHLNDSNLGGPGCGDVDFIPIMQALYDADYHVQWPKADSARWISVEVFDFKKRSLDRTARRSIGYLCQCEAKVKR